MKLSLILSVSFLSLAMVACSGDGSSEGQIGVRKDPLVKPGSTFVITTASEIAEQRKKWEDYRDSIQNEYQLEYTNTGFAEDKGVHHFSEVREGELTAVNQLTGLYTMDDLFERAKKINESADCEVEVKIDSEIPIIREVNDICGVEYGGVKVISFYEGLQIYFSNGLPVEADEAKTDEVSGDEKVENNDDNTVKTETKASDSDVTEDDETTDSAEDNKTDQPSSSILPTPQTHIEI